MKFKVGDKVKVLGNTASHNYKIGQIVKVIEDYNPNTDKRVVTEGYCEIFGGITTQYLYHENLKLVTSNIRDGQLSLFDTIQEKEEGNSDREEERSSDRVFKEGGLAIFSRELLNKNHKRFYVDESFDGKLVTIIRASSFIDSSCNCSLHSDSSMQQYIPADCLLGVDYSIGDEVLLDMNIDTKLYVSDTWKTGQLVRVIDIEYNSYFGIIYRCEQMNPDVDATSRQWLQSSMMVKAF